MYSARSRRSRLSPVSQSVLVEMTTTLEKWIRFEPETALAETRIQGLQAVHNLKLRYHCKQESHMKGGNEEKRKTRSSFENRHALQYNTFAHKSRNEFPGLLLLKSKYRCNYNEVAPSLQTLFIAGCLSIIPGGLRQLVQ